MWRYLWILVLFPLASYAGEGETTFHAFTAEIGAGESRDGTLNQWELEGWVGGDIHKLNIKVEGEKLNNTPAETSEFWATYSRNVSEFWDAQIGVRYDEQPEANHHLVLGVEGTAPFFLETAFHLFVSEDGDVTATLSQMVELLLTQRLILEPYYELELSAQEIPQLETGSGITGGEIGVQLRYEMTRKFAPYLDARYESKFGETADIALRDNESRDDFIASIGLRLMF